VRKRESLKFLFSTSRRGANPTLSAIHTRSVAASAYLGERKLSIDIGVVGLASDGLRSVLCVAPHRPLAAGAGQSQRYMNAGATACADFRSACVTALRRPARRIGSAFIAFAKSGKPDSPEIPHWPAYDAARRLVMIFDSQTRVEADPNRELRQLWDRLLT
jgi:hypothetical protein